MSLTFRLDARNCWSLLLRGAPIPKAGYVHGHIEPDNIWVSTDRKGRLTNAMLSHPDSAMHQGDRLSSSLASKSMPKERPAEGQRGARS